ncbi:ATP-binding cassette domain-containing protein [Peribacillus butanolivorans]|uniref:ATP-binding cassette domain-containing protein n=1 Tax=Peribacillus butanolivorans TaxID=421767 RepID=UPI00366DD25A
MELALDHIQYDYYSPATREVKQVLTDISCTIPSGAWVSIIGQTGSGKSTLAKVMQGLLWPTVGQNTMDGKLIKPNKKGKPTISPDVGLVFQYPEHQLFETTVLKELAFGPRNRGWHKDAIVNKAQQVIDLVGLDASYLEKSPLHLSGGEKRRVAIASVLMLEPKILILDEPTAGLDPLGRQSILQNIEEWRRQGNHTVILITHQMNDVVEYADEVIVLHKGKLQFQMNPMSLFLDKREELQSMGLDIPDTAKLLLAIEKVTGQRIQVASLKELDVMPQVLTLLKGRRYQYD